MPDMGIFQPVYDMIATHGRALWAFMGGLIVIVAMLGGMYYVLQGAAGATFGGSKMASVAIIGIAGLVIMVLIAFLLLPELANILKPPPAPF